MDEPLIDILMATYNGERFVGDQIESIQAQTYQNWRLLVSDDCSADGTVDVVRRYATGDGRIRIVSEGVRHGGAKENFFALMAESDAPYAMFCDQDDVWLPRKVEKSLAAVVELEARHGADVPLLVFCDMKVVDGQLNVVHESFERSSYFDPSRLALHQLIAHNIAAGCCMLFNRTLLLNCRRSTGNGAEMHDWWAMLVASAFGYIVYIAEPLSLYRQHGHNQVGANEYSPVDRARNIEFMAHQFILTAKQAHAFRLCYDDKLDRCNLHMLDEYAEAGRAKVSIKGIAHLALSGCWKRGARKLGQLAAVVMATSINRKRG
ncbi:glycosyltransferase family 2 protein [Paratractidigestivibacter sp.]|uniref:glycosyltransferase family 2 protein n=1 Tax=Paratractidigestivibacter sp. TaxID=2847316 RepID=UPI002AC90029|nr:glycosyltransferase family 2 protein [Paratractidigestivibacter sp.]